MGGPALALVFCISVLQAEVVGRDLQDSGDEPAERLAVVYAFDEHPSLMALAELRREVQAVLDIDGLEITWRDLKRNTQHEVFEHVVVARFHGECRMTDVPIAVSSRSGALGSTHISEGAIIPFADVDCRRVRDLIRPAALRQSPASLDTLLGRALGRVLAHELYHVLADTRKHARTGIAQPLLTGEQLVDDHLEFEPKDLAAIRAKVLPVRPPAEKAIGF
jgi:hypothetical protein